MEWERQRAYDFADGKKAGIKQAILGFASNGISEEVIAESLKMPLEDVHKIIAENKK